MNISIIYSVYLSLCLLQPLSTSASVYLSLCLPQPLSTSASVYLSLCLPQPLSTSAFVYLSLCLPKFLSTQPLFTYDKHDAIEFPQCILELLKTSRKGSSRDEGQSASNTGHPVLYGTGGNPSTNTSNFISRLPINVLIYIYIYIYIYI